MTKFLRYFSVFAIAAVLACGFAFAACGGSSDDDGDNDDKTKDVTPTVTTYVVTFEYGNGDAAYTVEVDEGTTVSAPADPTWEGYMFSGWYADANATTTYDFSAGIYANTTIYAGWTERREGYNYITYMWNYEGAEVCYVDEIENNSRPGSLYTATRDGYKLQGWFKEAACETQVTAGTIGRITEDITLYALWYYGYTFEAEYTDLNDEWDEPRQFYGYSNNYQGAQAIQANDACSNGYFMGAMYLNGEYLDFVIVSDKDVDDAQLYFSFAVEYGWSLSNGAHCYNDDAAGTVTLRSSDYDISVNGTSVSYDYKTFDVSGLALTDPDYPAITSFTEFYINNVSLSAGTNVVRVYVQNNNKGEGGTQQSLAPLVDYMRIYTDANLSWTPVYNV